MKNQGILGTLIALSVTLGLSGCEPQASSDRSGELTDDEVENIIRRSFQYVAMYNVNNKFALKQGGWNTCEADTELKDHTLREIARPNNDTFYIGCMLDLRNDALILEMPAFESDYVSLMVTAYDHYVNVPMSTRLGDFRRPEKMLFYSARTQGYEGEPVPDVDRVFENNILEVMQFVFNHTTFDAGNEIDQGVLAAYKPLGVEPGRPYDPGTVKAIDGEQFRRVAQQVAAENLAIMGQPEVAAKLNPYWMEPKGETTRDALVGGLSLSGGCRRRAAGGLHRPCSARAMAEADHDDL